MSFWTDKVVLVTGGSSGLGRIIAEAYVAAGCQVAIAALEPEGVAKAAAEMRRPGCDVLGVATDITRQEGVDHLFQETLARFGRLDVLVNNAGRTMRGWAAETTPEQFRDLFELNFFGAVRCTRAAVPHLLRQRGHLVNIGSLAAKTASRWVAAYPATKFALAAYSQQLRLELGPRGLHVLLVCPGPVARRDTRLYPLEGIEDLPHRARFPGAGARTRPINPQKLAAGILQACQRRSPELVMPARARLLFALSQLFPRLGDWILVRQT
jgi:uncharacterized protein